MILFIIFKEKSFPSKYVIKDISDSFPTNTIQNYSGAILVNLDEDDELEIFISVISDKNIFYKFKDGKFQTLSIPALEDPDRKTFAVTACDLNQDGRDEILIINSGPHGSRVVAYKDKQWIDMPLDDSIIANLSGSYSAACVDRKGDGKYGLAVVSENGPIQYLELQGSKIVDIASQIGIGMKTNGRSILGIPGAQGFTNIFVGNKSENFFFVNNHKGEFYNLTVQSGLTDKDFESRGISLIDINHDELIDVVYGNHVGPLHLLEQTRTNTFKDITPDTLVKNYAVNATVVADFNLDGYEDIYLNNIRNKNQLFARDKNSWYQIDLEDKSEKDMYGVSSIAADLDHNGSMDLLNTHGDGEKFPLTLYTFEPQNQFISFKIILPNKGIPRGAILRIKTSQRDLIKAINSGSGRFANYDDTLMFGMLKNETVQGAEILLPSGQKVIKNENFKMNEVNLIQL